MTSYSITASDFSTNVQIHVPIHSSQRHVTSYNLQPNSVPHRPLSSQAGWHVLEKELPRKLHVFFVCFTLSFYSHSFQKVSPFAHFLHLTHIRKQNVTIPAAGLRPNTNNLFLTFKYSSRKCRKQNRCRFCSPEESVECCGLRTGTRMVIFLLQRAGSFPSAYAYSRNAFFRPTHAILFLDPPPSITPLKWQTRTRWNILRKQSSEGTSPCKVLE